jgi:hypothetical protein
MRLPLQTLLRSRRGSIKAWGYEPPCSAATRFWIPAGDCEAIDHVRLVIPPGTKVYLGRPAKPAGPELVDLLKDLVAGFAEIREAHLPQCWVEGVMPQPAQILVVVLSDQSHNSDDFAPKVERKISALLPKGFHLDLWIIHQHEQLLRAVRDARCLIWKNRENDNESKEVGKTGPA